MTAACPYCGEPKDEHSWASPTFCSLGGFPPVRIENDKRATDDQPAASRRERLSEWYHGEFVLDTPTWCRPQEKVVGPGITVKTTYGYHVIVAFLYTGWKKLMRRG